MMRTTPDKMLSLTLRHMEHSLIVERFYLTPKQAKTVFLLGNLILEYASEDSKQQGNAHSRANADLPVLKAKSTFHA